LFLDAAVAVAVGKLSANGKISGAYRTENAGPVPTANPPTIPQGTNADGGEAFFEVEFKYRTRAMLEKVAVV
jgi:hypothetical protein